MPIIKDLNEFILETNRIVKYNNKNFRSEYLDYVSKNFKLLEETTLNSNDSFKKNLLSLLSNKNAIEYACKHDISSIVKYFIKHGYSTEGLLEICIENGSNDTIRVLKTYKNNHFNKNEINENIISEISYFANKNLGVLNKTFYNETISYKHLHLNKEYSLKFYLSEEFRNKVLNSVNNNRKKISLNLSYCDQINDVSMLYDIYELNLLNCKNITDVSTLGNVHTLILISCLKITDVSALGKVHTLDISNCPITDVSALGNVHKLSISNCSITDVSTLGKVHKLTINNCSITDVSALGKVYDLGISNCPITDVSALGNVHSLYISNCPITDVSALGNVHSLSLFQCKLITDVSMLNNVHKLNIFNF